MDNCWICCDHCWSGDLLLLSDLSEEEAECWWKLQSYGSRIGKRASDLELLTAET